MLGLIEQLEWVASLEDIDHEICDIAKEAVEEIIAMECEIRSLARQLDE